MMMLLLVVMLVVKIFREHGRGWGLRASEDVKKGQLVFEYVGEVIDDEELHVRTTMTHTIQ